MSEQESTQPDAVQPQVEESQDRAAVRTASKDRETEREKMRVMSLWLDTVCEELGVDRDLVAAITKPALGLISDVAHGPSRPGAPMTALVVGLAAARGDGPDEIAARMARIIELTRTWEAPATGGAA